MKVIRINWPLIRKLCLAIFSVYLFYRLVRYVTFKYEPTLSYNFARREFFVPRQWAQLKKLSLFDTPEPDQQTVRFQIKSSLIRYTKVPVKYWTTLIEKSIDLGLNTIEIELVWAAHEPLPTKFDFTSASNDLVLFVGKYIKHNGGEYFNYQIGIILVSD